MTWASVKTWLKARLRERSSWTGMALIVGAVAAGPLGFAYADLKDAALLFLGGSGLVVADTTTPARRKEDDDGNAG